MKSHRGRARDRRLAHVRAPGTIVANLVRSLKRRVSEPAFALEVGARVARQLMVESGEWVEVPGALLLARAAPSGRA